MFHHVAHFAVRISRFVFRVAHFALRRSRCADAALHGRRVEQTEALQNPKALDAFRDIPELRL